VVYQSPGRDTLDLPDNITTSNRGTLVVCEDNTLDNDIRGLSPEGDLVGHRAQPAHQRG